jgi:ferredoxin
MSEFLEERHIAGMLVRIDRRLCVAFEVCIDLAPEVFRFDPDGVVTFVGGDDGIERERLLESCRACPVDALMAFDAGGAQIVP